MVEGQLINIDEYKNVSRRTIHTEVAEVIAKENLETENRNNPPFIFKETIYSKYIKRIIDIIVSLFALIIALPINLIIAVLTLIILGLPLFYIDTRIGKDGKRFGLIKFRNMTNERDENGELLSPDKRITRWGRFVRKTSLDELLNFYSIFKGDMSVIGPRPLHPEYMKRYSERHKMRNCVKPGLECPMINSMIHTPTWYDQFENDVYYVEHLSFIMDCKQIISFIRIVFDREYRERSAAGIRGGFMGYTKDGRSINSKAVPEEYVEIALNNLNSKQNYQR